MFYFFVLRAIFLLYFIKLEALDGVHTGEALLSFWHAIRLDSATTGYLLIIPALLLFVQGLFRAKWLNIVNKIYTVILVFCWALVTAVELASFEEWQSKLTTSAFIHLHNIREAYFSISALQFFSLLAFLIVMTGGFYYLYKKFFYRNITEKARYIISPFVFLIIALPSLFVMLRGGTNKIAISQSAAYYSHHSILNWAAMNSGYHFAVNVIETSRYKKSNNYQFYDINEARKTVDKILEVDKDTTVHILTIKRPNIVLLLLESWTADIIPNLGDSADIAPEFGKLEKDGLLFTHFYSTGTRSHEGTASVFGGHPALPYTTWTANESKFRNLPSIVRNLNDAGYYSCFFYGGQLDYGNMRAYLLSSGFDKLVEEKNIDSSLPRGRLGIADGYLYPRIIEGINTMKQPFFSAWFTLSSHSPYDYPMDPVIDWGGPINGFLNSVYYADSCLGQFFAMARQQSWYDSTLFILVADHSHNSFKNWKYESFDFHHIPLLFYGNVLKKEYRGTRDDRMADNSSLAKTILAQLDLPADGFKWGSNLFNPYSPVFAYMAQNDGYAWKTPAGEVVYSMKWHHYYQQHFPEGTTKEQMESFYRDGKSYVQVLFQDFLDH